MELEQELQDFLHAAIKETSDGSVERNFSRKLTQNEIQYINDKLNPHGYAVHYFYCRACHDYSNGKEPFHIERVAIR